MSTKVRHRHLLKKKEIAHVVSSLEESFPVHIDPSSLETAIIEDQEVLLNRGKVFAFKQDDRYILSLRALLETPPKTMYVTVDMGAVRFVANGADIMSPGIVDADKAIEPGDLVWVRDENNLRPLALGKAVLSGIEMTTSSTGKAVKTIHFVGDKLWEIQL